MNRDLRLLSSFFLSTWLIDRPTGRLLLRSLLEGQTTQADIPKTPLLYVRPNPATAQAQDTVVAETDGQSAAQTGIYAAFTSALGGGLTSESQPGSIAVITIDYPLYDWYANYTCWQLDAANRDENVAGIILKINCPGGVDQAAYRLSDMIRSIEKPVVGMSYYGLMASAAYWVGSACDYVLASRATDRIGSIGVYIPFFDDSGYWESMGFSLQDVYAPESSEKNIEYRTAQKGDYTLLEEQGSVCAQTFIASVQKARGTKLNKKAGDPFKGALYYAADALKLGLIDEIGPFDRAVEVVSNLANGVDVAVTNLPGVDPGELDDTADDPKNPDPEESTVTTNQSTLNQSDMALFGNPHKKLAAFKGREASAITPDEINDANAELIAEGITGAVLVNADWIAEAQQSLADLATANAKVTTLTTERNTYKAQAEAYGDQPGTIPTSATKVEETVTGDGDVFMSETDMEMHRREASIKRPA